MKLLTALPATYRQYSGIFDSIGSCALGRAIHKFPATVWSPESEGTGALKEDIEVASEQNKFPLVVCNRRTDIHAALVAPSTQCHRASIPADIKQIHIDLEEDWAMAQ